MRQVAGDGAALVKAICDDPDDDIPRLVYADWLDEQGGASNVARAEFIRLQIAEAAKGGYHPNGRLWAAREKELYRPHYQTWAREVPTYPGVSVWTGNEHGNAYERGFPFALYAKSVRSYLKAAPKLFPRVPVTKVRFATITPRTAGELACSPWIGRIQYLDQLNGIGAVMLETLAGSPHLGNLRRALFGGTFTAQSLRSFLGNPSLTGLKRFNTLQCRHVGSGIVSALIASSSAPVLEEVSLYANGIGLDAAADLPALVRLPSLRELNLGGNRLGDVGLIALAGTTGAGPVRVWFGQNEATDRGAEALLSGPLLRSPTVFLGIGHNRLSDGMKVKLKDAFGDRVTV
jgi:uncharacterized protein (TIGR02996 family)